MLDNINESILNLNRAALDAIPGMIAWKDLEGNYLNANNLATQHMGWKNPQDIIGHNDYAHPCRQAEFAEEYRAFDKLLRAEKRTVTLFCYSCFNGNNWRLMFGQDGVFVDSNGVVAGTVFNVNDVTDTRLFTLFCSFLNEDLKVLKPDHLERTVFVVEEVYSQIPNISIRESECLFFMLRGNTAKEIAQKLKISHRTVECHIDNIKYKLNCQSKTEVIQKAIADNLLFTIPRSLLY